MRRKSCALLELFLLLILIDPSDGLQMKVRPERGSTVTVSTDLPSDDCAVCTVSGVNDTQTSCHSSLSLIPETEVQLLFRCSKPMEEAFTVSVTHAIECTADDCSPSTVEAQPALLHQFARTFTWEITAPEKTVVGLNILGKGLMETSQPCQNGYQYSITNSQVQTQYCQGGSVTHLDLLNEAVVSLQVKPNTQVGSALFQASAGPLKGRTMVVTVDSSTALTLSRDTQGPECEVCSGDGSAPSCDTTEKTLSNVESLPLEFSCLKPQDVYSVKMKKTIECTQSSCTPAAGDVSPDLFKDFSRSVTWDISVPNKTVLTLDFTGDGLKEISTPDKCQDGYQYTVSTTRREGVKSTSYCRGGTLSHLDLPGQTTVSLEAPKDAELGETIFSVTAAPRGNRNMYVTPDPNTRFIFKRQTSEPDCSVCWDQPPDQKCDPEYLTVQELRNISVEFSCSRPQDVFSVEINKEVDCISCTGDIIQAESSLFSDFNRSFTWDVKTASTKALTLDFPEPGMRQIPHGETCPDAHTYIFIIYLRLGLTTIGRFCKGGTVTNVQMRYRGRMALEVSGDRKLDAVAVKLSAGPETTMVATVKVSLPRGVSNTVFFTANYPGDFPDRQQMQWDFSVPGMHNYTMHFGSLRSPECLNSEVVVEYNKDKKGAKLSLTDPQPEHQQGNFRMVLMNCETNRTLPGLALNFTVSVMRSGHPVLCTVDLTKHQRLSLQLEKVGSDPYCEMSFKSQVENKINVAPGSKEVLSFLDCPKEDVRLTASELWACQNAASCTPTLLTVPKLPPCLPVPLHSFTWHFSIPQDSTIDLVSPSGGLRQSLPGQECNGSVSLHVAQGDGFSVGDFCSNGIIQKVQVHANMSVTATARNFTKTKGPFLNATFSQEIPETIIYRVSPRMSSPTMLATPNWPNGMKPSSTVSWIVTLPSQYQAHMQFNVSQPKCQVKHTAIKVQMLGFEEELMSRREDEQVEDKLLVPQSFYLNMSNCVPEDKHFGALTKIVLQKKSNLLAILLGIAGVLLLLLIVLAVVCFITRKKKKERMNKESSIYIGKGNIFRPGDMHFSKTRSENDSHVYASIDETMVYGHLLGNSSYADSMQDHFNGMQVDSYNTFTGPKDGELPVIKALDPEPETDQYKTFLDPAETFIPSRPRTPIDRQDSLGFQDRRMVDNELYTFKSTGDFNPIRLSGADMDARPPSEESL
ncbi:CUB domain-containing protein 1 isoform 2-T2 [Aulostomus maculatus]